MLTATPVDGAFACASARRASTRSARRVAAQRSRRLAWPGAGERHLRAPQSRSNEQRHRQRSGSRRCGLFGLGLYAGLILRPGVDAYSRLWQRVAATVLSLYVLAVLVGVGVVGSARRRLLLGLTTMSDLASLDAVTEAVESGAGLPEVVRAAARGARREPRGDRRLGRDAGRGRALAGGGARRCSRGGEGVDAARRCASPTRSWARCTCAPRTEPSAAHAPAARDDDRLGGRARARPRARLGTVAGRLPARDPAPRADDARGGAGARARSCR